MDGQLQTQLFVITREGRHVSREQGIHLAYLLEVEGHVGGQDVLDHQRTQLFLLGTGHASHKKGLLGQNQSEQLADVVVLQDTLVVVGDGYVMAGLDAVGIRQTRVTQVVGHCSHYACHGL